MRRAAWPILAVSVALIVAGCTAGGSPAAEPTPTASPPTIEAPAGLDDEASEAWNRWQQLGWDDYTYRLTVGCFCPAVMRVPVQVTGGDVVRFDDRPYNDQRPITGFESEQPTIDALFEIVAEAQNSADEVTVTYDEVTGAPTKVFVDWIENAIDDEISYAATTVTAWPHGQP